MKVRVRFAPSPTGFLHIGGARTALFNWLYARHAGGTFILRIEDTDVARNTQEAVDVILNGLRWLGLDWDEGPVSGDATGASKGDYGPYFQSQRKENYQRRVEALLSHGLAYEHEGAIKFKMPREPIVIPDVVVGNVRRELTDREQQDPDFVIVRSDGQPVFHLVNVVDDLEMNITHVIRGEDHLSNTAKHIALFRAFGVEPPQYAHVPVILNPDGTKMSKSDPDAAKARLASLQTYVEDGYVPEAVRNYLCLLGWSPKDNREKMSVAELQDAFSLEHVNHSNATVNFSDDDPFDAKAVWLNAEHIRTLPVAELVDALRPFAGDHPQLAAVTPLIQERIKLLRDVATAADFFFAAELAPYDPAELIPQKGDAAMAKAALQEAGSILSHAEFTHDALEAALRAGADKLKIKAGQMFQPIRVAACGRKNAPPLFETLLVLGREVVLKRIAKAVEIL